MHAATRWGRVRSAGIMHNNMQAGAAGGTRVQIIQMGYRPPGVLAPGVQAAWGIDRLGYRPPGV